MRFIGVVGVIISALGIVLAMQGLKVAPPQERELQMIIAALGMGMASLAFGFASLRDRLGQPDLVEGVGRNNLLSWRIVEANRARGELDE